MIWETLWQDIRYAVRSLRRTPGVTEDRGDPELQLAKIRTYNFVAPGFFHTVGSRVIAGRDLTWTEVYERRPIALVSENLARELWGESAAAIGKRIRVSLQGVWREVIGVVGDVTNDGTDKPAPTIVYWPVMLNDFYQRDVFVARNIAFVIRSSRADTTAFIEQIQDAVWAVNNNLPLADIRTLGEIYDRSMARTSFTLVMLAIAGSMALFLGLVGIYAVMSSSVSQRTREIAIRIAVGAQRAQVIRHLLRDSLALTVTGVIIGVAAAAALTRFLEGVLFGITPLDPITFLIVPLLLTFVSLLAAHLPVSRTSRVDPSAALRAE